MYFHKSEGATAADGLADAGAVAMARGDRSVIAMGVPDVAVPGPGALPPSPPPATVIDRPIPELGRAPALPSQRAASPRLSGSPSAASPSIGSSQGFTGQPTQPAQPNQPAPKLVPEPKAIPKNVTSLPGRDKIFMMVDDSTLQKMIIDNIAKEHQQKPETLAKTTPFPLLPEIVPPGTQYLAKTGSMPPNRMIFEPGFVLHHRLHFEEKNAERQGWDLGILQPAVSLAYFYRDMLLWPNSLATGAVVGFWDTNMGKCLPGSSTPYYFYPPGLTITGLAAEGLVITGLSFIIP